MTNKEAVAVLDLESSAQCLADLGIQAGAEGRRKHAVAAWVAAEALIAASAPASDFHQWLRTGLADALCEYGRYEDALELARLTQAWSRSIKQPLASICAAKSLWALGRKAEAEVDLREAVDLGGKDILLQFPEHDRDTLRAMIEGWGTA